MLGILVTLVVFEQFPYRGCQVLVGSERSYQRTQRQVILEYQITTNRIKEKRGEIHDEVVQ